MKSAVLRSVDTVGLSLFFFALNWDSSISSPTCTTFNGDLQDEKYHNGIQVIDLSFSITSSDLMRHM